MFRFNTHLWFLVYVTIYTQHSDLILSVHAQINFPDNPAQPVPADYSGNDIPGLDGRQGTTLPGFPTLPASLPTAIAASPVVNIVTPTTGQTCICVPTGQCTPSGTGNLDGSGIIDIRIVNSGVVSKQKCRNYENSAFKEEAKVVYCWEGVTPVLPGVTTLPITSTITSCSAGLVLCCQPGPYQCGVRYPPVVGAPAPGAGQAPYASYPWQGVILGQGDVYIASGVCLNNLNLLTAAHKVAQYVNSPTSIKIRMGEWNAASATEPIPAQEFIVSRIFIHPNFNSGNLKNDVALLRLSTSIPLGNSPAIATACLPSTSFAGTRCFVSGWGRNDFTAGSFQSIQKQVDVPVLQATQCQSQLAATRLGSSFIFDSTSFICAGGEAGKDACTGDGGSPLVCQIGTRWFVAGLVAWGIGCGTTNVPGVYVNVASYVPWIQTTLAS